MKEKKIVLMMLFSIAFIVLIFTAISAVFDSILVMKEAKGFRLIIGILELISSILGIVFCVFYILEFFINKRKWLTILQYVSASVVLVFFIISVIVAIVYLPIDSKLFETVMLAFLNVLLNIIISEMIVFLTSFFIKCIKRKEIKEEQNVQEQQALEQ